MKLLYLKICLLKNTATLHKMPSNIGFSTTYRYELICITLRKSWKNSKKIWSVSKMVVI